MMNIRILLCLLFLVHVAFARVAKDVTGVDMSMTSPSPPSSPMPEEEEPKPAAMPGLKPVPMLPSTQAVADKPQPQAPPHSHSQVGTGDEPFGSADLEPEEVSAPNPGSVGSGPVPPSSPGAGQLPDDDDTSEESDEDMGR